MDIERLQNQLKIDEGVRLRVYADSLGKLTVGVGHLVLPADGLKAGDTITQERCDALFEADTARAISDCQKYLGFIGFDDLPDLIQEALVNLLFNLGVNRLLGFKKFLQAVRIGDYSRAADELVDSLWHRQVGARALRIEEVFRQA